MKSNYLINVRSNCDFSLDYEKGTLNPQTEVILITTATKYVLNKNKTEVTKDFEVQEIRFKADLHGINTLIGELQLVVKNMNAFEQTAGAFNAIIKSAKEQNK